MLQFFHTDGVILVVATHNSVNGYCCGLLLLLLRCCLWSVFCSLLAAAAAAAVPQSSDCNRPTGISGTTAVVEFAVGSLASLGSGKKVSFPLYHTLCVRICLSHTHTHTHSTQHHNAERMVVVTVKSVVKQKITQWLEKLHFSSDSAVAFEILLEMMALRNKTLHSFSFP